MQIAIQNQSPSVFTAGAAFAPEAFARIDYERVVYPVVNIRPAAANDDFAPKRVGLLEQRRRRVARAR